MQKSVYGLLKHLSNITPRKNKPFKSELNQLENKKV